MYVQDMIQDVYLQMILDAIKWVEHTYTLNIADRRTV